MIMKARSSCIWKYGANAAAWADITDGTNKKDADVSGGYRELRSPDREKYFRRGEGEGRGWRGGEAIVDIIIKWASTSGRRETRWPLYPRAVSAWYLERRWGNGIYFQRRRLLRVPRNKSVFPCFPGNKKKWSPLLSDTISRLWPDGETEPFAQQPSFVWRQTAEREKEGNLPKGRYIDRRRVRSFPDARNSHSGDK